MAENYTWLLCSLQYSERSNTDFHSNGRKIADVIDSERCAALPRRKLYIEIKVSIGCTHNTAYHEQIITVVAIVVVEQALRLRLRPRFAFITDGGVCSVRRVITLRKQIPVGFLRSRWLHWRLRRRTRAVLLLLLPTAELRHSLFGDTDGLFEGGCLFGFGAVVRVAVGDIRGAQE